MRQCTLYESNTSFFISKKASVVEIEEAVGVVHGYSTCVTKTAAGLLHTNWA